VDEACEAVVKVKEKVSPDPRAVDVMNQMYAAFRRAYPATKTVFS
jgi:hypothetical protein